MSTLQENLISAGIEPIAVEIYLILLNHGELPPKEIISHTSLSRASIHDALALLLTQGLVTYRKEGRNAYYAPEHPNKLFSFIETKKRETSLFEDEMKETIRNLTGAFNLTQNKPGVRFFEGIEGVKEVLKDTFINNTSKILYTYTDLAGYADIIGDWNSTYYAPKRKEMNIRLKALVTDEEKALKFLKGYKASELTEILFLDHTVFPLATEVNIYDGRVSFVSFAKDKPMGVLIENHDFYLTMKSVFEFAWKTGNTCYDHKQPTWDNQTQNTPHPKKQEEKKTESESLSVAEQMKKDLGIQE